MVIVVDGASGIRSSHVVANCISCSLCKGMLSFNIELFSFYSALLGKAPAIYQNRGFTPFLLRF